MIACFGPRRLLVGWCPCWGAYQWNASMKSSVIAPELFPTSCAYRLSVRSPCGVLNSHTLGAIVGSRFHSGRPRAHLCTETANDPVAIDVVIVGTDRCSLCTKALLSVRRIVSSVSPPLAYEHLPDSQLSAWPLTVRSRIARSSRETNLGLQTRVREEVAAAALGSSANTARGSLLSEVSGAEKGSLAASSSEGNEIPPEFHLQEKERGSRDARTSQIFLQEHAQLHVRVRVGLASLDSAEAREILGLCERDVQRLREEVPIVLVGGKPVSRLKFNGPAVRAALLQELRALQGEQL
ncbi:hypothetical protein, conserved [Eimeria praecox]|uniref:Glutaredoxin domain-containing protein n=1 Tax=Eimeria praecox TaxID=51316 RepID=U6G5B5_9EIME|nr:hypothetical protein, conserved [Eimeria praecox]